MSSLSFRIFLISRLLYTIRTSRKRIILFFKTNKRHKMQHMQCFLPRIFLTLQFSFCNIRRYYNYDNLFDNEKFDILTLFRNKFIGLRWCISGKLSEKFCEIRVVDNPLNLPNNWEYPLSDSFFYRFTRILSNIRPNHGSVIQI